MMPPYMSVKENKHWTKTGDKRNLVSLILLHSPGLAHYNNIANGSRVAGSKGYVFFPCSISGGPKEGSCYRIPAPFSRQSRIPNFCHLHPKERFPFPIPHTLPRFRWIPLTEKRSNPTSRQEILRFPESRTIFRSNPASREYHSRPCISFQFSNWRQWCMTRQKIFTSKTKVV